MSDPIIALLQNPDPKQRKRGIAAAAKSTNPRYLKYLARLAKADPEADLRKLAKKAGTYIHQQQQQAPADDMDALRSSVVGDDARARSRASGGTSPPTPARPIAPPSTPQAEVPNLQMLIQDSSRELDPAQAESHYNNAFEFHLKGNNARAALELGTAFYLNPAYGDDATAVAFAAEMTDMAPVQAVPYIANPDNWRDLTNKHGGFKRNREDERSELQSFYLWFAGAVLLLIVVGLLVWVFQSGMINAAVQQARFGTPTPITPP